MAKTGRDSVQQMLRLPDELRDQLREAADANARSLNAEIVLRLEESVANTGSAERIARLELEKHHLGTLYGLERKARRIGDELAHSSGVLLFVFADMVRRYADGDAQPLERFIEQAKTRPEMLDFEMPTREPEDDDA